MLPSSYPDDKLIAELTAKMFLDIKAVHFNPKEPFTLASGLSSPTYIDCRKLISYPQIRSTVMDFMACKILRNAGFDAFDNIAGGVQIFVEEIVKKLFFNIYKKYKVKNFYLSGGVSMNIKMNKMIKDFPYVKNFIVQPSGGDESLSIGGCYLESGFNSKSLKLFLP